MVFHVGALWRLNESGILPKLDRVSSVSGGSITAGVLGMNWHSLTFDPKGVATNFDSNVVNPIRAMAGRNIDIRSAMFTLLWPTRAARKLAKYYRKYLFKGATLQSLPADGHGPRFVINATNVQTGSPWRFSRPYMGDSRVGLVYNPELPLAEAVAASSAFPPALSPMVLRLDASKFVKTDGAVLYDISERFRSKPMLCDGGVYDNLGLESVYKRYETLLVSDAGQPTLPNARASKRRISHTRRVMDLIDLQVRKLRSRQLMSALTAAPTDSNKRYGAYWSIRTRFTGYKHFLPNFTDPLNISNFLPNELAGIPTRLSKMKGTIQEKLINWGYAICDAALRRYAVDAMKKSGIVVADPLGLPYPKVVW